MRRAVLLLTLTITGCFNEQLGHRFVNAIIYGPDRGLMIALYAYRAGARHWPASPADLKKSSFLEADLNLDRYKNLTFETLTDDRLAVAFDSYVSPDTSERWSKYRF